MVVEEANERVMQAEERAIISEEEVDSLKSQLADYQQALDVQQTRALQYQQAVQALDKARRLLDKSELTAESAQALATQLKAEQETRTSELLALKHKLDMSSAAAQQFNHAFELVKRVLGEVARSEAAKQAQQVIRQAREAQNVVQNEAQWQAQQRDLERQLEQQRSVRELATQYHKQHRVVLDDAATVELERERHSALLEELETEQENCREQRGQLRHQEQELQTQIARFESIAPAWIKANDALESYASKVVPNWRIVSLSWRTCSKCWSWKKPNPWRKINSPSVARNSIAKLSV